MAGLAGESNGSAFFSVEYPDGRFAIRMFDQDGDEVRALVLNCPGETPPAAGSYTISTSLSDCAGIYSRVHTTDEGEFTILETAEAVSGELTVTELEGSELTGSFGFQGTLMVESDARGTLFASGTFSATTQP